MKVANKQLAQQLFIQSEMTRQSIASSVGVTEKTLRKWIEKGEWDKLKDIKKVTRTQLLQDAYSQLKAVNEKIKEIGGVPTKELYDAKSIIGKEIERLSDHSLSTYVDVFQEFIQFLVRNKPSVVKEYSELSMNFLNDKQNESGK